MKSLNVLGQPLSDCSLQKRTGFFRNGCCETSKDDRGRHVVCAEMTTEFLEFSRSRGNDLVTPNPMFDFPGLKEGDRWCLCAARWLEAFKAGYPTPVLLNSTEISSLEIIDLEILKQHAIDIN